MDLGLEKQLNRFYEEMEKEESFDIGELACSLVPKLEYKIRQLEKQIDKITSEPSVSQENTDKEKEYKNMKMSDLMKEKYPYKLRTVECIEVLKEQNEKRLKEANLDCKDCLYGACTNSLNEVCIENQCLTQLISVYDELVSLCLKNNLIDENSRVVKVYK